MSFGLTIAEKNQIETDVKRKVWIKNGWPWPPRKRTEYELAKIREELRMARGRHRKR